MRLDPIPKQPATDRLSVYFGRACRSYDQAATIQRQVADQLIRVLLALSDSPSPRHIVDLGTGTGYLAEQLYAHYPNALYELNDRAEPMLAICQARWANQRPNAQVFWRKGRIEDHYQNGTGANWVVSNLACQWIQPLDRWLDCIRALYYSPSAPLVAWTGLLADTFADWFGTLRHYGIEVTPWPYPTAPALQQAVLGVLRDAPKHSRTMRRLIWHSQPYTVTTNSLHAGLHYLRALGAQGVPTRLTPAQLRRLWRSAQVPPPCPGEIRFTYQVYTLILQ